jgi:hypothetical protein
LTTFLDGHFFVAIHFVSRFQINWNWSGCCDQSQHQLCRTYPSWDRPSSHTNCWERLVITGPLSTCTCTPLIQKR